MVLVGLHVQESYSCDRADGFGNSFDDFLLSALAKVWDALYKLQFCGRNSPLQSRLKTLGRAGVNSSLSQSVKNRDTPTR